jgi:queuine tRNA-ribosyltransferase
MSCEYLSTLPFDGYSIGGSFGKTKDQMFAMLDFTLQRIPQDKPNHVLGIADLFSVERIVALGADTFDSSHPTRCARHGHLFTAQGDLKIQNSVHRTSFDPIDPTCSCTTCTRYTRAYLHHLFKANEMTGYSLATVHNIHFMVQLMQQYRAEILNGEL